MTPAVSNVIETNFQAGSVAYPGVAFEISIDGRKVSGSIRLGKPNPMGRRACRVNYLLPAYWSDEQHAAALRVAAHWFRDIGGIDLPAKRQLCHIVSRLKAGDEEQTLHWAIDAYAKAKWHRKHKRWKSIAAFFHSDGVDVWMDRSDGWRELLETHAAQMDQRNRAERRQRDMPPLEHLAKVCLELQHKLAVEDARLESEGRLKAGPEAFKRLTREQQSAIVAQCPAEDWDCLNRAALREWAKQERCSEHDLMRFCPRTPYKLADLTAEIARRDGRSGNPHAFGSSRTAPAPFSSAIALTQVFPQAPHA